MASTMLNGWALTLERWRTMSDAYRLARAHYPTMAQVRIALRKLRAVVRENRSIRHMRRCAQVNGRTFHMLTYPGRPSKAWDTFLTHELHRVHPIPGHRSGLTLAMIAFTRKCPLRCAHCSEGAVLNRPDVITAKEVVEIVRTLQRTGVAQIELSGGEPLSRFDELMHILENSDMDASDFWVLSSGHGLSAERARTLRDAGVTGVAISLDHWDAHAHDTFRGLSGSFERAHRAVLNARAAGLVVALSLVPLRNFCNMEDLLAYARLAHDWKVHFIRLVEPRAAGNFSGKDVELTPEHHAVLDQFVHTLHRDPNYRQYPIVDHYGAYQRAVGCSGAGSRYLFIDTAGEAHACPFCQMPCGSALENDVGELRNRMMEQGGCHVHPMA
jgi:MoaA/NifB/PqqE/SkfB family radical SAM enzyme